MPRVIFPEKNVSKRTPIKRMPRSLSLDSVRVRRISKSGSQIKNLGSSKKSQNNAYRTNDYNPNQMKAGLRRSAPLIHPPIAQEMPILSVGSFGPTSVSNSSRTTPTTITSMSRESGFLLGKSNNPYSKPNHRWVYLHPKHEKYIEAPTYDSKRNFTDRRNKRKHKRRGIGVCCSPCCFLIITGVLIGLILLGALIASIVIIATSVKTAKVQSTVTTTTSTTSTTTTSTISTTTTSTTSTTITSTTTTTTATTTTTTETTTTTATTTTTTETTTTTTTATTSVTTTSETTTSTTVTTTLTTSVTTTVTITTTTTTTTFNPCGLTWSATGTVVTGNPGSAGSANNRLDEPHCVYVDSTDAVYVCDSKNNRIQKFTSGSSTGSTVAGGVGSGTGSNELNYPVGMTFDKNGDMYVVDKLNCRVQKYTGGSSTGSTVAGTTGSCSNGANELKEPSGIAVDDNLSIYIGDTGNDRVRKYTQPSLTASDPFSGASFLKPYDIFIVNGSANEIYTSEISGKKVEKRASGSSVHSLQITDGSGTNWNEPAGIVIDPYGNLYVADHQNGKIKRCCAGSTSCTTVIDGSSTGSTQMNIPISIALDSNLNMYVVAKGSHALYKFNRI